MQYCASAGSIREMLSSASYAQHGDAPFETVPAAVQLPVLPTSGSFPAETAFVYADCLC